MINVQRVGQGVNMQISQRQEPLRVEWWSSFAYGRNDDRLFNADSPPNPTPPLPPLSPSSPIWISEKMNQQSNSIKLVGNYASKSRADLSVRCKQYHSFASHLHLICISFAWLPARRWSVRATWEQPRNEFLFNQNQIPVDKQRKKIFKLNEIETKKDKENWRLEEAKEPPCN